MAIILVATQWAVSVEVALVCIGRGHGPAIAAGGTIIVLLVFALIEFGVMWAFAWVDEVLRECR